MSTITFRCPSTRQYVQQIVADETDAERNAYMLVNCPACGKVHFLNRSTHKLLGHERE
ncbi:hypothetical protein [Bradyrhizobium cenepequi]|jgi:uncharacterized Zn finger protein